MRAIVIDDNEGVRRLLALILGRRGWAVQTLSDPTSLACPLLKCQNCALESGCCDLLLTDVHMPRMSGIELSTLLLRNGCTCKGIAFISGECSEEERRRIAAQGFVLLLKPFDLDELGNWLSEMEAAHAHRLTP